MFFINFFNSKKVLKPTALEQTQYFFFFFFSYFSYSFSSHDWISRTKPVCATFWSEKRCACRGLVLAGCWDGGV